MKDSLTFQLSHFSGPLEFLIALVQNQELSVEDITLQQLTHQYLQLLQGDSDLDSGAEFVGSASFLIWLKSKQLLPQHEQGPPQEDEQDPRFEIIHHLIDYCRFREAAKHLSEREQRQNAYYMRGATALPEIKKNLGIEHLTLDDFASLFGQLVAKSSAHVETIQEEEWKASDKIELIKELLKQRPEVEFSQLFAAHLHRNELIVIFLAVLEMMKNGDVCIIKLTATGQIMIASKEKYAQRN